MVHTDDPPAVGTIREGREIARDRHCICPWRMPVNHDLLLATFALNKMGHAALCH